MYKYCYKLNTKQNIIHPSFASCNFRYPNIVILLSEFQHYMIKTQKMLTCVELCCLQFAECLLDSRLCHLCGLNSTRSGPFIKITPI